MKKTLNDMAVYLKDLIPAKPAEAYVFKPMFHSIGPDEALRTGVEAFHDFLCLLYDILAAEGKNYETKSAKAEKETHDHTSLPVTFPFLNAVKSILINIGYYGSLSEEGDVLLLENPQILNTLLNAEGQPLRAKMTVPKLMEGLRFLSSCGLTYGPISLNEDKPDLLNAEIIAVSYPASPHMLIGLKAMAVAQKELYTKGNDELFLRCDYRVLKEEQTDLTSVLEDFLRPLSKPVRMFALGLHRHCLDKGLTCHVEIRYLRVRFSYSYKKKELWMFSASLNHGCRIFIKGANLHQYVDAVETFPPFLRETIGRGYG